MIIAYGLLIGLVVLNIVLYKKNKCNGCKGCNKCKEY